MARRMFNKFRLSNPVGLQDFKKRRTACEALRSMSVDRALVATLLHAAQAASALFRFSIEDETRADAPGFVCTINVPRVRITGANCDRSANSSNDVQVAMHDLNSAKLAGVKSAALE